MTNKTRGWKQAKCVLVLTMLICMLQATVLAQSPSYHAQNHEVGLRSLIIGNNITTYTTSFGGTGDERQISLGAQAYYLHLNDHHTFWRASAGLQTNHYDSHDVAVFETGSEHWTATSNSTAIGAEFAVGKELPIISKPVLERLKLRLGVSISEVAKLTSKSINTHQAMDTLFNVLWITETKSEGESSMTTMAKIFFQGQYRVFKQCFVGLEWGFGPTFSIRDTPVSNSAIGTNPVGDPVSHLRSSSFSWRSSLGVPSFSIGYSF